MQINHSQAFRWHFPLFARVIENGLAIGLGLFVLALCLAVDVQAGHAAAQHRLLRQARGGAVQPCRNE